MTKKSARTAYWKALAEARRAEALARALRKKVRLLEARAQ